MKKSVVILSLSLILSLALTACAPQTNDNAVSENLSSEISEISEISSEILSKPEMKNTPVSVNTEGYNCIKYPGVDWGITKEELFEILGKSEEEFDKEVGKKEIYVRYVTENEFLGKQCLTAFEFNTEIKSGNGFAPLTAIHIGYELEDESHDDFKAKLEEYIKSQGVEYTAYPPKAGEIGETYSFEVNEYVRELPQDLLTNTNNYWYYLVENDMIPTDTAPTNKKEDLLKRNWALLNGDASISEVNVWHTYEDNVCKVEFNSYKLITPLAESQIYLKQMK